MLKRIFRLFMHPQRIWPAIRERVFPRPVLGICAKRPWLYTSYVPDRYSDRLDKYISRGGTFERNDLEKFLHRNVNNAGDITRFYFMRLTIDQLYKEGIVGDVAELGVHKGNTAFLLAQYARRIKSTAYLLDTFAGFDQRDLVGIDAQTSVDFSDTSLKKVTNFVGIDRVRFIRGFFPATANEIPDQARFAIVHIDCDLEAPFRAALAYFYPKLLVGGFLIMHDYASLCWDGAEHAVDEFFRDKSERLILIPDKSGTAVVRKI
jgi:hypothetical protein